jgi:hypothetical protein
MTVIKGLISISFIFMIGCINSNEIAEYDASLLPELEAFQKVMSENHGKIYKKGQFNDHIYITNVADVYATLGFLDFKTIEKFTNLFALNRIKLINYSPSDCCIEIFVFS